jgi:hypothetical protein
MNLTTGTSQHVANHNALYCIILIKNTTKEVNNIPNTIYVYCSFL